VQIKKSKIILDIATGTGDLAILMQTKAEKIIRYPAGMYARGKEKLLQKTFLPPSK
jgi:demethylmenaquinone methyltransferase/2-methoxy-6-polyprenyl-1,4-benzoquinol methylase